MASISYQIGDWRSPWKFKTLKRDFYVSTFAEPFYSNYFQAFTSIKGQCRLQTKTRISRMEKEIRIINKWHQRIQPANRPMEVPSRHPFLLAPGRIPNNSAILILARIGPRQRIAHVCPLACIIRNDPGHFVVMFGHQLGRIVLDGGIEGVGPLHDPRRETTVSKQLSVDTKGRRGQKHLFRSGNPISISIEQVNDQIQYKL